MRKSAFDPTAEKASPFTPSKIKAEIAQDMAAYDAYVEKYGSPSQMLRDHLADRDEAVR